MKAFLHRTFTDKGLLLVLLAGLLLTLFFFGQLVMHPASRYFGLQGDGMQIYYQTAYHVKHDTAWWQQQSMNYPDGENLFFTGALPMYTNIMKVFGSSAAEASIGILNLLMLFSPLFGAIFLYALFRHLRLPWWYGALCGLGIMFLSPQIGRMSGHYSLALSFLLPALIYSLVRFYDYPRRRLSLFIGLLLLAAGGTHLYLLVFCLAACGMYWFILFITRDRGFGRWKFVLLHFSLQVILPVLLIQLTVMLTDHETDRTSVPWGFTEYIGNWSSIFYPYQRFYEPLVSPWFFPKHASYEAVSYIGVVGAVGLIAVVIVQLVRLVRRRFDLLLSVSDRKVINILCWTSLLLVFLSFGWPFLLQDDGSWLKYAGPFRQFRALGRFNWMFYYMINILAVYRLWKLAEHRKGKFGMMVRSIVPFAVPAMLLADGWDHSRRFEKELNNKFAALDDTENTLPENRWLRKLKVSDYQAILPLPYYHNGSECAGIVPDDHAIFNITYAVSLKTGLPMLSMLSGRSSIGKANEHINLIYDPVKPLSLLNRLPDKRPFLVLARKSGLSKNEQELLDLATPLYETAEYNVYSLQPVKIAERVLVQYDKHVAAFTAQQTWPVWPFMSTDSLRTYACRDYEEMKGKPFRGKSSMPGTAGGFNELYFAEIPGAKIGNNTASFWFADYQKDLYGRTTIELSLHTGDKVDTAIYCGMFRAVKALSGSWALAEIPFILKDPSQRVQIVVWNHELPKEAPLFFDELQIKHDSTQLFDVQKDSVQHNNRTYYRKQ